MLVCLGGRVGFLFYVGMFRRYGGFFVLLFFVLCWRVSEAGWVFCFVLCWRVSEAGWVFCFVLCWRVSEAGWVFYLVIFCFMLACLGGRVVFLFSYFLFYIGVFRRQGGFFVLLFLFFAEKPYAKKSIKQTWLQCSNMSDLLKQTLLLQGQNMSTFFKTDFIVTMPRYVYLVLTLKS